MVYITYGLFYRCNIGNIDNDMQQGNNDSLKSKALIGEEDCQRDYEFLDAEPSDIGFDIFYKCKHCNHNAAVTPYTNENGTNNV
jgi:hypothetical protein